MFNFFARCQAGLNPFSFPRIVHLTGNTCKADEYYQVPAVEVYIVRVCLVSHSSGYCCTRVGMNVHIWQDNRLVYFVQCFFLGNPGKVAHDENLTPCVMFPFPDPLLSTLRVHLGAVHTKRGCCESTRRNDGGILSVMLYSHLFQVLYITKLETGAYLSYARKLTIATGDCPSPKHVQIPHQVPLPTCVPTRPLWFIFTCIVSENLPSRLK